MDSVLLEICDHVVEGEEEGIGGKVQEAMNAEIPPQKILNEGLIVAMKEVGARFENGIYFLPEMMRSARTMKAGLAILRPYLVEEGVESAGKVVIGTVQGDLHDIGKNLVSMMLEGAGFEVVDLGVDVPPERFAEAVREYGPDVVGISALLSSTMEKMKSTLEALEDLGVRDHIKVIVGGAPVDLEFAQQIGADGYAPDASRAVTVVKSLI